jgi:hypothetical protein
LDERERRAVSIATGADELRQRREKAQRNGV